MNDMNDLITAQRQFVAAKEEFDRALSVLMTALARHNAVEDTTCIYQEQFSIKLVELPFKDGDMSPCRALDALSHENIVYVGDLFISPAGKLRDKNSLPRLVTNVGNKSVQLLAKHVSELVPLQKDWKGERPVLALEYYDQPEIRKWKRP